MKRSLAKTGSGRTEHNDAFLPGRVPCRCLAGGLEAPADRIGKDAGRRLLRADTVCARDAVVGLREALSTSPRGGQLRLREDLFSASGRKVELVSSC